jgi:hypothetical protein
MGHKGHYGNYSGNHPRFSKRQDEAYDAKMAYNKDLTGKARLHYLENDIADKKSPANSHCSPMGMHTDAHIKRQQEKFKKELEAKAKKIARRTGGDFQDEYYKLMSKKMDERSGKKRSNDERSGEERRKDIDEMIYERPDSPMNQTEKMGMKGYSSKVNSNHTNFVGDYSFNDAFKKARETFGSKGTFSYKGKDYTTQYAEEKSLNDLPKFGVKKTIKKK